ncbi:MAG TPA: hypothetical protein VMT94_01755 [Burkholderiales bacterium]|nr:hypothetical protein [Burkholderiales bacterium]
MINYRKMCWAMLIALGVLGWNTIGWTADEPSGDAHAIAPQSGYQADRKPLHVWRGPINLSYVEIDELKLSPAQQQLWEKAQQRTSEAFDQARVIGRNMRDQLRVDLDKPGTDLKQIILREEEIRPQIEAAFKPARDAWFTAYDSLDADQKERLREAVREGMEFSPAFPVPPAPIPAQPH